MAKIKAGRKVTKKATGKKAKKGKAGRPKKK